MNKLNRFYALIFTVALTTLSLSAKEFISLTQLLEQAGKATVEKYPDSDTVLLDDFIQTEYQADGTSETWDDTAVKVLTEKGKRSQRTLTLHFNISYGTNYFSKVQIIKPDGMVKEIDPVANSKVMVDPGQMRANIYNPNSKVSQLSIPGLEIGDTLRYITHRIQNKTVVPDTWSDYQTFEHASPIERTTYQVIAPKERPLINIAHKAEVTNTVNFSETSSEQSDKIIYTWEVRDVPRMFDEPNMPARYTVVQRLLVSTIEQWEDLSKWYWNLCLPRLEAVTPEMASKAKELTSDCTNTLEKINAIFNFVSQDIRYMGITTEEEAPGYEPHDVRITFENRYGVCRDKAALLAAMLRLVDIEAFPVIIMVGPKKDEEVPQPFFNHAVTAALDDDGTYVLMDSTDENTKDIFPSYLQNMSYIVARPEGETLLTSPIIPAEENLLKICSSGSLDHAGNMKGESTLLFEGINDTVYRGYFSKIKPEERRRFFEGQIKSSMPTAKLESIKIEPAELRDTTHPLKVHLSYSAKNLLINGNKNKLLNLPKLGSSLGYANFLIGQTGLEKRKYPLFTRMTAGISETLTLSVPSDLGTVNLPDYSPVDTEALEWNISIAQTNGLLSATNTFLINAVEFTPEEYLDLKSDLKEIEYNLRKKLIINSLKDDSESDADVRWISNDVNFQLNSSTSWAETNRATLEILTYAGKKEFSELKFRYNPSWQNIKLNYAKVTLPNGTVKEIREEEINIMDADWVASAARYPAEKILVANLPGVEVGSVLEYEYVSTVDGKPFFSTSQNFNGHNLSDCKTVTLRAPAQLDLKIRNTGIEEIDTSDDQQISRTWILKNQPAVKKEEALPAWWTFNPVLFISTGDWKNYGQTVREHLLSATKNQPETSKLAKQLTENIESEKEKVIAVRNWVAENLRSAGPGLNSLPFSAITPADQTLSDRYGNNPDRMVVLYALLEESGLKPDVVLSGLTPLIPEAAEPLVKIPARGTFNTVLVKVEIDGNTIYLDGSSQYSELGTSSYDQRSELNLETGQISRVRVAPGKDNRTHTTYELTVLANGQLELSHSSSIQGTAFEGFHRKYAEMTPEKRRRHYLELISDISHSAKSSSDLSTQYDIYPGRIEYSVVADRYAVQDGDYLYFTIPTGVANLLKYQSTERTLPLAWNNQVDRLIELNINLPDGYEPAILPQDFSWEAPNHAGLIEIKVEYSEENNTIRMVQMADLQPALIQAKDFPNIISAGQKLSHPDTHTILLKKKD